MFVFLAHNQTDVDALTTLENDPHPRLREKFCIRGVYSTPATG